MLEQIGPEGQQSLARASAIVIGAGGLGSPILTYLVAAGVGRVGLIDADTVSSSNLNRQFLYAEADIGKPKAARAGERLASQNGGVNIVAIGERLTHENAAKHLSGYDLVLGAVDSFGTRHVINRASAALRIPYIDGGLNGFCGTVMFSQPGVTACLNCVFPDRERAGGNVGVVGVTAGVIGSLEANLALLWLLHRRNPVANKLIMYDGFKMCFDEIAINRDRNCPVCGNGV